MNRREFLTALGCGSLATTAGCNALPLGSNSSSAGPTDSDLDGVPDEDDYAPWDDSVQNKSDVLDEYGSVKLTPEDAGVDESPGTSFFARTNPPTVTDSSSTPSSPTPDSMSAFTEYSTDSAQLRIRPEDAPGTTFRILLVARQFPRRGIHTTIHSDETKMNGPGTIDVKFSLPDSADTPLYLAAYLTPDKPLSDTHVSDVTYLHETSPFTITDGELQTASTEYELEDVSGDTHARTTVEGGYAISLTGQTNGDPWTISYFVSRAAYEQKRRKPRGRRREEYVRYAMSNGTGSRFAAVIQDAARDAGFTTQEEQTQFVIDAIQSLPYVLDSVGTGYDDYSKFIEETMTEVKGDCEDTTIALAVLLRNIGYNIALIEFPSHIGVGIAGDHTGSHVTYNGTKYYYLETTSEGWQIGGLPDNLDTSEVHVSEV